MKKENKFDKYKKNNLYKKYKTKRWRKLREYVLMRDKYMWQDSIRY